uniref:Uncharacterized protein n=1 Tax=Fagus sylvatica TaxID=28930 RepID=A0A2N9H1U2_FAGSY
MKLIQASDLGSERGKNEIERKRESVDQEEAPLEADGGRRMDGSFVVRRGHLKATMKLGTAVVNGGGSRRVASLTTAISSEIKAMAVAVAVAVAVAMEDGSGAGTTTCYGAPCARAGGSEWIRDRS